MEMWSLNSFMSVLLIVQICCVWSLAISSNAIGEIGQQDVQVSYTNVEWICISDADCTTEGSSCVDDRCQCPPHYVFNAAMTSCLKAGNDYGDTCQDTSQCTAFMQAGGICEKGTCICSKGYHYLHGRCHKSAGLNEKCQTDDDCYVNSDYGALSCRNQTCVCRTGFYQREYRTCRLAAKEPGAECTINQDCIYDKNAKCNKYSGCYVESKNQPQEAALRQSESNQTAKVLKALEGQMAGFEFFSRRQCTSDKECEVLGEAFCDSSVGSCFCKRGYFTDFQMLRCVPEIGEKCVESDISIIKNATCRIGQWSCKGATVPSKNNRICREAVTFYTDYCEYDEECYVFGPDASCVESMCRCNSYSHYSYDNKFCWVNRGIGENCKIDEDCFEPRFRSELSCNANFVCACPKNTHLNAAGTDCVKDVPDIGDRCSGHMDCKGLKNSMCSNGFCSCAPYYFELSGQCVNGINAPCKVEADCKAKNSTCVSEKCSCMDPYVPADTGLCVEGVPLGGDCQYDAQCVSNIDEKFCNADRKCDCPIHYLLREQKCYQIKGLNEPCDNTVDECWNNYDPNGMSCIGGFCGCADGFITNNHVYCVQESPSSTPEFKYSIWIGLTIFVTRLMGLL